MSTINRLSIFRYDGVSINKYRGGLYRGEHDSQGGPWNITG